MNPIDKNLVYNVSRWQRFLYEDEKFNNQGLQNAELNGLKTNSDYDCFQKEVFARLYTNNGLNEVKKPNEWAQKLHQQLDDSREFNSMSSRCKGDEFWSGMACTTISKSLNAALDSDDAQERENAKQAVDEAQNLVEGLEDLAAKGAKVSKRMQAAKAKLERAQEDLDNLGDETINIQAVQRAIKKACGEANDQLNDVEQSLDAMIYDDSPGSVRGGSNTQTKREMANKLATNYKLQQIAKLAGRLRRIAAEKQRSKAEDACSEIKDIVQGDSIDRLLPSELLGLVEPELETMFYSKLLEKQLLQYELAGKEKAGQGPIIVCIDESGSMRGDRDVWAKAVALAMLDIARKQKRSFAVIHFGSRVERVDIINKNAEVENLVEMIDYFSGGGTNFEATLNQACDLIENEGMKKADVVFITDGACEVSDLALAMFADTKRELEFSLYSIAIRCLNTSTLDQISDKVFHLQDLLDSSEVENILFSI